MSETLKIARSHGSDPELALPRYETAGAAGMDLRADTRGKIIIIKPGEIKLISTGLCFEIPIGYEIQIRPRSGLALKFGITMVNAPGTIDSDYRGEVGVILINFGSQDFEVNHGDRIAQMVFAKLIQCDIIESTNLMDTERGTAGFGSTGKL